MLKKTRNLVAGLLLCGALHAADRYQASEPHMGTLVTITLYADDVDQAQRAFVAAFRRIQQLDDILSDYKPGSELSRACESSAPLSPALMEVLVRAQALAEESHGAFDITVGPVVRLWRAARAEKKLPMPEAVRDALSRSGFRKLEVLPSERRVRCAVSSMKLDAGGIAKGYAADQALREMRAVGVNRALVVLSGDIAAGDAPPGRDGWSIQAQDRKLTLANRGVSTSGDDFQYVEIDGVRFSHIVDPRTGMALTNSRQFTVVAPSAIEADALATAISVCGNQELARKYNAQVITR